jgi:hypothetical protein
MMQGGLYEKKVREAAAKYATLLRTIQMQAEEQGLHVPDVSPTYDVPTDIRALRKLQGLAPVPGADPNMADEGSRLERAIRRRQEALEGESDYGQEVEYQPGAKQEETTGEPVSSAGGLREADVALLAQVLERGLMNVQPKVVIVRERPGEPYMPDVPEDLPGVFT